MFELTHSALSIWEIAHRWHDQDPNLTDPSKLPLDVQDKLRFLTKFMAYHDLASSSRKGVVNWTEDAIIAEHEYMEENNGDASGYESYYENVSRRVDKHRKIVENFNQCYDYRIYDKEVLDNTFTVGYLLAKLCKRFDVALPKFWYPDGVDYDAPKNEKMESGTEEKKYRNNQLDKVRCQTVAQMLWAEDSELTIVEVINHKSLKIYGNGGLYKDDTLREWVKRLDPRPEEKRRGRPKNKN